MLPEHPERLQVLPSAAAMTTALFAMLALVLGAQAPGPHRDGAPPVDVFVGGTDGYAVYRIPSSVRLPSGRVLAFAEARGSGDDNGSNDLVMRTSDDRGATWAPMRVVLDQPGRSLNNPCAAVVRDGPHAGRTVLLFQSYPTGRGEREVGTGYDGDDVCRTYAMRSDDGGTTWSAPADVTRGVKHPAPVTSTASGPGIGIQLRRGAHAGRIVMPFNEGPWGHWRVYAAWSDDAGETWSSGTTAAEESPGHGNEVQLAERADGSILMVSRQFGGNGHRKITVSADGGATWSPLQDDDELADPSCMGGLVELEAPVGTRALAVTGPDSAKARTDGCAWISWDGGERWPVRIPLCAGSFAYSVPVALGDGRLGVLFERDDCTRIAWTAVDVPPEPRWELEWSDEFDVPGAPDPAKWDFERGFVRNKELQLYRPENARVEGGMLVIEARREQVPNPAFDADAPAEDWMRSRASAEYTSASLTTRGRRSFLYGRIEARMRIDIREGMWPAFWSVGAGTDGHPPRPWPDCGELDVMEFFRRTLLANAAFGSAAPSKAQWRDSKTPIERVAAQSPGHYADAEAWARDFHVWAMEWDERRIVFRCDGRQMNAVDLDRTFNARPDADGIARNPLREPQRLILNLAVGATGGDASKSAFPARLEVDWVRAYRAVPAAGGKGAP